MELPAISLSPESSEPLYRQLYASIKSNICNGNMPDGVRLPASRELALSLRINRTTVAAAYKMQLYIFGLISIHFILPSQNFGDDIFLSISLLKSTSHGGTFISTEVNL